MVCTTVVVNYPTAALKWSTKVISLSRLEETFNYVVVVGLKIEVNVLHTSLTKHSYD